MSYSRADAPLANALREELGRRGFVVFQDSAEILAGEDFVERIVGELRRSDAVISLQTAVSAASEWCQAELYHAHALGVPVIPVQLADGVVMSHPLELLQRRVHRLTVSGEAGLSHLPADLDQQLRRARARRLRRTAARAALGSLSSQASSSCRSSPSIGSTHANGSGSDPAFSRRCELPPTSWHREGSTALPLAYRRTMSFCAISS